MTASGQSDELTLLKRQRDVIEEEFQNFTYTVSHDLGAPLRAIVNFSRILSEKYSDALDEKGLRYLQFVTDGGEKLQAMLAGLIQYSRIDTQAKEPSTCEMSALIGQCHATLKEKIAASGAAIRIHGTLPRVSVDSDQYFQLLLALIDNALTFRVPGIPPQIEISAKDMGGYWQFRLEDNGIGIAPAYAESVFEVFRRLHGDEEYAGVGMGLALAKKIVTRHGGGITVSPGKLGGVLCCFTLPKIPPEKSYGHITQEIAHG